MIVSTITDATLLSRLVLDDLPAEMAQALLRLRWDQKDLDRLHDLVMKNQDGALTPSERSELDSYLRVSSLLDLMHARARRSLQRHA